MIPKCCFIPDTVLSGTGSADLAAVMLEFHKRTYCDQNGRSVPDKLKETESVIRRIMADCVDLR